MTTGTEIVLLKDTYQLTNITSSDSRSKLLRTLTELDERCLSDIQVRKYFEALKLAMSIFIQKVSTLESDIVTLRQDQIASETRMEAMYLKAQLEIQELRTEISQIRLSKGRISQIVKVAKALQGNAYAPYAVKSLVEGVIGSSNSGGGRLVSEKLDTTKLPNDFTTRLEFAQRNGFKWNHNNRIPNKAAKQLKVLEEWEDQFCGVESLTIEQVLDKKYVVGLGAGAVAGALMILERELGGPLPERSTHSVFNCYQKAIKLYGDSKKSLPQTPCIFDVKTLVLRAFSTIPLSSITMLQKRLETRNLGTLEQGVLGIKKLVSKSILPSFIVWEDGDDSNTEKVYSIQSGKYDRQIEEFLKLHLAAN